jgi:hypothetical protein
MRCSLTQPISILKLNLYETNNGLPKSATNVSVFLFLLRSTLKLAGIAPAPRFNRSTI